MGLQGGLQTWKGKGGSWSHKSVQLGVSQALESLRFQMKKGLLQYQMAGVGALLVLTMVISK